jgi:hypothetical protein
MLEAQRSRRWVTAAVAAIGLTAATVVVAMAARAPLSSSTPIDAASARAPVTALVLLLAGAGLFVLATLLILLWDRRRRSDDPPELVSEPPDVPWFWKLLASVLPFAIGAALVAAAVIGARRVNVVPAAGSGIGRGLKTAARPANGSASGFVMPTWLPWTVLAIVVVAVAAGLLALARRGDRPPREVLERSAAGVAVDAAIDALQDDTDPRRAVIAAYAAMQRAFAAHGLARSPAEAPREFLRRVLIASSATEREAGTLTGLFEEARFSTHPIPERARELALSALRSLESRLPMGDAG